MKLARYLPPAFSLWLLTLSLATAATGITFDWDYCGDQLGAEFGAAVSSAGDVNGDGFDDVLIGAPKYDQDSIKGGAVFAFYGSAGGLETVPGWTASSDLKGARFGAAISGAGDVNGDGFDDVIIGAYHYNGELPDESKQPEEGRVFLYYGSAAGLSPNPGWLVEGNQSYAQLGYAVSRAGDVNGDGFDDVIIGARWFSHIYLTEGAALVFLGSVDGPGNTPAWIATGGQAGAAFGSAVSTAGDINGDGFDDVIIGAPMLDTAAGEDTGAAYVYLGSASGLASLPVWDVAGPHAGAEFGAAVSTAGRVNNDSFADVVIGAPAAAINLAGEGAAYLFFGTSTGLASAPGWLAAGEQENARFGAAVSHTGDINQDGLDEFIVGAPFFSGDQASEGAIFIYSLGGDSPQSWQAEGNKADTNFGAAVSSAGDINHTGNAGVIVGAPLYRIETDIRGRVFVDTSLTAADSERYLTFIPLVLKY